MKTRHAAALMLVGAYLIIPPLAETRKYDSVPFGLLSMIPRGEFRIYDSFDTVAECKSHQEEESRTEKAKTFGDKAANLYQSRLSLAITLGFCVPSDSSIAGSVGMLDPNSDGLDPWRDYRAKHKYWHVPGDLGPPKAQN
ncbi:MAG: hypothetical protein WCE23_07210 [Candidatus Binatus sp.]|uniref:hypothetical protein n=1 Tax=Candidatus Binatus sp. TaxID=2811406 RepID=UPI003C75AD90